MEITAGVKKILIITGVFYLCINVVPIIRLDTLPVDLRYNYFSLTQGFGRFNPIQLLTHSFVHYGFWDLLRPVIVLIFFGSTLEIAFGEKRFLQLFFIAALGSALISNGIALIELALDKVNPDLFFSYQLSGGDGAIYGILGAFAAFAPDREFHLFLIPVPIKAKFLIGFYTLLQMVQIYQSSNNYIAYACLAGIFIGIELVRYWRRTYGGKW
jgi:membrane associated rhomboid family serine protease